MGNAGSSTGSPLSLPAPQSHRRLHPVPPLQNDHGDAADPAGAAPEQPVPVLLERHMAVAATSVRIKEETLRLEPDDDGRSHLVAFSFDADAPGRITVYYFAQEDVKLVLKATKESMPKPVAFAFKPGHNQQFKQPCGSGIDFSLFGELELTNVGKGDVFPVALRIEVVQASNQEDEGIYGDEASKCLAKFAVFVKKENADFGVNIIKQTLWMHGTRYVLQEVYGSASTSEKINLEDDIGKSCVVCLSKPRTTTILPCRHLCLCRWCAQALASKTNKCPICRHQVERLLEVVVSTNPGRELIKNSA